MEAVFTDTPEIESVVASLADYYEIENLLDIYNAMQEDNQSVLRDLGDPFGEAIIKLMHYYVQEDEGADTAMILKHVKLKLREIMSATQTLLESLS